VYSEYTERERGKTNGAIIQAKYQKNWTAFCNISTSPAIFIKRSVYLVPSDGNDVRSITDVQHIKSCWSA
jgi:hypothetical protein